MNLGAHGPLPQNLVLSPPPLAYEGPAHAEQWTYIGPRGLKARYPRRRSHPKCTEWNYWALELLEALRQEQRLLRGREICGGIRG